MTLETEENKKMITAIVNITSFDILHTGYSRPNTLHSYTPLEKKNHHHHEKNANNSIYLYGDATPPSTRFQKHDHNYWLGCPQPLVFKLSTNTSNSIKLKLTHVDTTNITGDDEEQISQDALNHLSGTVHLNCGNINKDFVSHVPITALKPLPLDLPLYFLHSGYDLPPMNTESLLFTHLKRSQTTRMDVFTEKNEPLSFSSPSLMIEKDEIPVHHYRFTHVNWVHPRTDMYCLHNTVLPFKHHPMLFPKLNSSVTYVPGRGVNGPYYIVYGGVIGGNSLPPEFLDHCLTHLSEYIDQYELIKGTGQRPNWQLIRVHIDNFFYYPLNDVWKLDIKTMKWSPFATQEQYFGAAESEQSLPLYDSKRMLCHFNSSPPMSTNSMIGIPTLQAPQSLSLRGIYHPTKNVVYYMCDVVSWTNKVPNKELYQLDCCNSEWTKMLDFSIYKDYNLSNNFCLDQKNDLLIFQFHEYDADLAFLMVFNCVTGKQTHIDISNWAMRTWTELLRVPQVFRWELCLVNDGETLMFLPLKEDDQNKNMKKMKGKQMKLQEQEIVVHMDWNEVFNAIHELK